MHERIVRFGLSGLTFGLAILFGFWYFGGDMDYLKWMMHPGVTILVVAIFSTPVVGLMVSSVGNGILFRLFGIRQFLPPAPDLAGSYFNLLNDRFPEGPKSTPESYDLAQLCLNHQVLFREYATPEAMKYSCRRMDMFWVHMNTIGSIVAGLLTSLLLVLYLSPRWPEFAGIGKCLWISPILFYLLVGSRAAIQDLRESNDFEKKFLVQNEMNRKALLSTDKPDQSNKQTLLFQLLGAIARIITKL